MFTPSGKVIPFTIEKILEEEKNKIDIARHPDNIYYIYLETQEKIEEFSMIRLVMKGKTKDENI